ncbi:MAG: YbbR-like domain-containing protein [Oscillospiraceae bacterium]
MASKFKFDKNTLQKAGLILVSLICALLFWVYVTETEGEVYSDTFSGVKVVFEGESNMRDNKGLIINSIDTTSVRVKITGDRRIVANLDAADLTAVIDLSSISRSGNYSLSYKIEYPNGTDASSLTVETRYPSVVNFYVDKLSKKSVEIKGVFNGNPAEGYSIEPMEFNPSTVVIYGPETVLAEVDHAYVQVDREDLDKTLTFDSTYQLVDKEGELIDSDEISLEMDTVSVTVPVISIKTVDLTLDFIYGNGVTKDNVKYTIDPESITLTGDSQVLAGRNNITLDNIDLSEIDGVYTETYSIVIPNDTEIVEGPKEATVTIEIVGLATRTVSISRNNLSFTNLTDGFEAEIISDSLDNVKIRGKESVLNSISTSNIYAVADLSELGNTTGIAAVPVKIYIDGTADAGAVGAYGTYKIYVNITKSED